MRQGIISAIVLNIIVVCLLSGCPTPQSVIDLGNKTETSQSITAKEHLKTLSAYRSSLLAFKTDLKHLLGAIIKQQQIANSSIGQARKNSIKLRVDEAVEKFDEEAITFLAGALDTKLEERYWPQITKKYEEYKSKESMAKQKLEVSPGDPVFQKQYREFGIFAEYLLRIAYENESKIRQYAFTQYTSIRQSLKIKAMSIIANQTSNLSVQAQDISKQIEVIETNIDDAIVSIDLASIEIKTALENEAGAIKQINAYLTRPREWELVLQGITSEINNVVGGYTNSLQETVLDKIGVPAGQISKTLYSFDLTGLVDSTINTLNEKIDSKISEFKTKVPNKSADENT